MKKEGHFMVMVAANLLLSSELSTCCWGCRPWTRMRLSWGRLTRLRCLSVSRSAAAGRCRCSRSSADCAARGRYTSESLYAPRWCGASPTMHGGEPPAARSDYPKDSLWKTIKWGTQRQKILCCHCIYGTMSMMKQSLIQTPVPLRQSRRVPL